MQGKIDALVESGAVIEYFAEGGGSIKLTLAKGVLLENPRRLRWCAIFPEHQSHVHDTTYDAPEDQDARGLVFYAKGRVVLTIMLMEKANVPENYFEGLEEWRRILAVEGNESQFAGFFDEA